jgi:hypothetical protein
MIRSACRLWGWSGAWASSCRCRFLNQNRLIGRGTEQSAALPVSSIADNCGGVVKQCRLERRFSNCRPYACTRRRSPFRLTVTLKSRAEFHCVDGGSKPPAGQHDDFTFRIARAQPFSVRPENRACETAPSRRCRRSANLCVFAASHRLHRGQGAVVVCRCSSTSSTSSSSTASRSFCRGPHDGHSLNADGNYPRSAI